MASSSPGRRQGRTWQRIVLGGCLGAAVLAVVIAAAVYFTASQGVKRSEVYQEAVARLRAAPAAVRLLGEPVETGAFAKGRVGDARDGTAQFTVPVSGPRASGTLHVQARRAAGGSAWTYEQLELAVDDNSLRVSLLPSDEKPDADSLQLERLYQSLTAPRDSVR